jgi:putative ABC transport system ATP-binding protein
LSIATRNLTKIFLRGQANEVTAVDDVNISIQGGDFVAVTGPSGSGKSTLLNLLGLLTYPTNGDVMYGEQPVTQYSDGRRTSVRRDMVGFIFQQYNLLPYLSAWENAALPLICRGVSSGEMRRRAVEVLSRLGMEGRVDFRVAHLSGGEQQRVAIARALIAKPKIVIADEPTASVDEANAKLIIDIFKDLKSTGRTIIVSTHDAFLIREATRRLYMAAGKLKEADND